MADMEQPNEPMASTASHPAPLPEATLPASPLERRVQEHGWLLPTLLHTDTLLYGRWDYLAACWEQGALPDAPIPRMEFLTTRNKDTWKMITASLDAIPNSGHGGWAGWSGSEHFRFFLEWVLHGFGHAGHAAPPKELAGCEGACQRLERTFDLALMQQHPYDHFGDILAENAYGKRQGFFPTPHALAELITQMTIGMSNSDTRALTVMDPCVGTGRMLLHASNFSLRLYGQEINSLLCLATLVNGYMFAPWLVRPLPYLDYVQYQTERSAEVSEAILAQAPPHQAEGFANTEHDTEEQYRFEPVKKRRVKGSTDDGGETRQGALF